MNLKIRIFLIAVGLSALLWLVNHLNREYTVVTTIHITFRNGTFPDATSSDTSVLVDVKGSGFTLLRQYFREPISISLNKSDFRIEKHGDSLYYNLISENLLQAINKEMPSKMALAALPEASLSYSFISYPSKTVPVKVLYTVAPGEGCTLSGLEEINPSFIVVSGPVEVLKTIDTIRVRIPEKLNGCDTIHKTFPLTSLMSPKLSSKTKEISISIPFSQIQLSEKTFSYRFIADGKEYHGEVVANLMIPVGLENQTLKLNHKISGNKVHFSVLASPYIKVVNITPDQLLLEP